MSSRNLKLVLRILEAIDNAEIPIKCPEELARKQFKGFDIEDVKRHFSMLCQHGCFLLKNETWYDAELGFRSLSWKGFELLEQLQKSQDK